MRERKKSQSGLTNWDNSEKTFPERISWTVCKREITLTEHCTKGNNSGKNSSYIYMCKDVCLKKYQLGEYDTPLKNSEESRRGMTKKKKNNSSMDIL